MARVIPKGGTTTVVSYIVRYDSGATTHWDSLHLARRELARGYHHAYGMPFDIIKETRRRTLKYEAVE